MMNPRLFLAALLISAPLLAAQDDTQKIEAQKVEISLTPTKETAQPQAAQPQQEPKILREPFRITINFKTTDGSKITTQRSYSLVATTESFNPSIRDNSQVPTKFHESYNYQHLKTNVDIRSFSKEGDSVHFGLAISTTDFAAGQDPNAPVITHDHEYTVSPTLPIGKLTTVYSSVDAVNDTKVEVQVLVQPLNAK
jgi:hypothetical protein